MSSQVPRSRHQHLMATYGLSEEDYAEMWDAQEGLCWICERPESRTRPDGTPVPLSVDHRHDSTSRLRALLCSGCNFGLGHFRDNCQVLERAIIYLRTFGSAVQGNSK